VPLGQSSGKYELQPKAGSIEIVHVNYDPDDGTKTEERVIYSKSSDTKLGAVVYQIGETEIAYQGGGVWRKGPGGSSTMISPPEFHYQGDTLTFPVIQVTGDDSVSGPTTGQIDARSTEIIYPDGDPLKNPLQNGKIRVTVQSEYWQAWTEYFETRTDSSSVDTDPDAKKVTATLRTLGPQGSFPVPRDDKDSSGAGPVEVQGLGEEHDDFEKLDLTLRSDSKKSDKFSSLDWSMYVQEDNGNNRLELHVGDGSGNGECGEKASLTVYYSNSGGNEYHGWKAEDALTIRCDAEGVKINIDFVNNPSEMKYTTLSGKLAEFNPGKRGGSLASSVTFEEHAVDPETTYSTGSTEKPKLSFLVRHYFALLGPDFKLRVADENNGNSVDESASSGNSIKYSGNSVIAYLHISENTIRVEFS
jgi:hypothetical protein